MMVSASKYVAAVCGEEKPTRCHSMIYCSYVLLYMFRALICPSSGAPGLYLDYNTRCEVPKLLVVTSSWFFFSTYNNDALTNIYQMLKLF
jgi:hypothetical protein